MMQDSFDALTLHTGEGPELMIGLGICSPLMLSPTDESSNPFFISPGAIGSDTTHLEHLSYSLIMDGEHAGEKKRHLLTPQDLPLFSHFSHLKQESEDCDEDDFFSMISSIKRQRLFESPVPFSTSSSHTSSASSTTPSEAGSDLDAEGQMPHLNTPPFHFGLGSDCMEAGGTHNTADEANCGVSAPASLQQAGSELTVRLQRRPEGSDGGSQGVPEGNAGMMGFNTFNLSDFISDHEQEVQHQLLPEHPTLFTTPERPLRHQAVRSLTSRPNIYSPVLSMSPATPGLVDGLFHTVQIAGKEAHIDAERLAGRRAQEFFMNRGKVPMRSYSDLLESLSCNPSQITPPQRQMTEAGSDDGSYFFSSSSVHEHSDGVDSMAEGDEEASISPPTPYSFINSDACPNLWSLAASDAHQRDVFDEQLSPMSDPEGMPLKMALFSPSSDSTGGQQLPDGGNADRHTGLGLQGVQKRGFRSSRVSTLASSRFSASPYQSPLLNKSLDLSDPRGIVIGGQMVTGIITKRSRGRRVPNNPQEINNLGKSGKVYTCKVPGCGKCFKRSEHLKRHVRSIHTNEKPYTCHCGKTFSRHDNLNQHARVHGAGGSPVSQPSSLSPSDSPLSLPYAYVESHVEAGRRASVHRVSSRLRKAMGAGEAGMYAEMGEDYEDEEDLRDD